MYEWGSSTMLNPTSAPCDERLFLSAVSDAMRPMLLAPMERPRSQAPCAMAPNRHKTRRFPPAAGSPEPSVYGTTWTSLLFVWTWMGSGYAKDPYGEVHLKELIRLQITFPKFLFYWFHFAL